MASANTQPDDAAIEADEEVAAEEGGQIIHLTRRNTRPSAPPHPREGRLSMFAGLAVVAVLIGMTVWTINASQERPARSVAAQPDPVPGAPGGISLPGLGEGYELGIAPPDSGAQTAAPPLPAPDQSPVLAEPGGLAEEPVAEVVPVAAAARPNPTVVYQSGGGGSSVAFAFEPDNDGASAGGAKGDVITLADKSPARRTPAKPGSAPAQLLGKGTLIPAVLETAIDADVAGGVRAVVSNDVLSSDGKRALVPRSSRLIGQYKSRKKAGQSSAYVVWTQIVRPDGTRLDISSSAAGANERQFFARFGEARLVSVVAGQPGADLRARQGEPVRIVAARDIELSKDR